jgi:hypothetical protein
MTLEEQQIDILRVHLPYELDMLDMAYAWLAQETDKTDVDRVHVSMCIECFCLHARNLIEFFQRTVLGRTAAAVTFTNKEEHYEFEDCTDDINDQICHLNYNRHTAGDPKLIGAVFRRIKESIDRAVSHFQDNLTQEFKNHWTVRTSLKIEPGGNFYLSTTNAISIVTFKSSLGRFNQEFFTINTDNNGAT